jgi:hypothetical protein
MLSITHQHSKQLFQGLSSRVSSPFACASSSPRRAYGGRGRVSAKRTKATVLVTNNTLPKLPSRVGRYVLRPTICRDIRDSHGVLLLTPARNPQQYSTLFRDKYPTLFASALLDCEIYCQKSASASSIRSGSEAARRLLRGKRDLLTLIRKQVERAGASPYLLKGHSVPDPVLQDHVQLADLLLQHDAVECQVIGPHADWMKLVRSNRRNQTTVPVPHSLAHKMDLYVTVMNRMAKYLGPVLRERVGDKNKNASRNDKTDTYPPFPFKWRATMARVMMPLSRPVPPPVNNKNRTSFQKTPTLLVQWLPPARLLIRLVGEPNMLPLPPQSMHRRKRARLPQSVMLSFEAHF